MEPRPLEVSCIDLDGIRKQLKKHDTVLLNNSRPLTEARKMVLRAIAPEMYFKLVDPSKDLEVPIVDDQFHQWMINEARIEARFSSCMWRQVGCVLADPEEKRLLGKTHNDPLGEGEFCKGLDVDIQELLRELERTGERLEFCTARHAENAMGAYVYQQKIDVSNLDIAVSVDPCDHCAYTLAGLKPKGVYIDFQPDRKYYNTLGLKILQTAGIPTYLVRR